MAKVGFVALIGRPNTGKSSLLNRLIRSKVSIVSDKPQTTRRRILGVLTRPGSQIIFVDTPGVHRPGYRLNERMMGAVYEALRSVDLVLHMVDASQRFGKGEKYVLDLMRRIRQPAILLLNKVDLINKGRLLPMMEFYHQRHEYREIIPISARKGDNLEVLLERIAGNLPERDFEFPIDYLTDQPERFLVGELIREKVLDCTRQELPYSTAVLVEEFDEGRRADGLVVIRASIMVEKGSQKKIVVGRAGRMIKTIGTRARKEIQRFLDVPRVGLELRVNVAPEWRNREVLLDQLGVV